MKNQMKANLFAAAVGLTLFGVITISATGEKTPSGSKQQPAIQEQNSAVPAAEPLATEPSKIPFTFYLTLVTTFTNGGFIDFDLVGGEGQSFIWNEMPKWGREQ